MTTKNSTMYNTIFFVFACCVGLAFSRILDNYDNFDDIKRIDNDKLIVNPVIETELEDAGKIKEKRCPRVGAASSDQTDVVGAVNTQPTLRKDLHDHVNKQLCKTCKNRHACKVLNKCDSCKSWCDSGSEYSTVPPPLIGPIPEPVIGSRMLETTKLHHQIITVQTGTIKDQLSDLLGISNKEDINTLGCWAETNSNNPPVVNWNKQETVQAINSLKDIDDNKFKLLTNEIRKQKEAVKEKIKTTLLNKIQELDKKFLSVEEIKKIVEDTIKGISSLANGGKDSQNSVVTNARNNFEEDFLPRFPMQQQPETLIVPQTLNPGIIEGPPDMTKIVGAPLMENSNGDKTLSPLQNPVEDSMAAGSNNDETIQILEYPIKELNQQDIAPGSQILGEHIDDATSKTRDSNSNNFNTNFDQKENNVQHPESIPEKFNIYKVVDVEHPFARNQNTPKGKVKVKKLKNIYKLNKPFDRDSGFEWKDDPIFDEHLSFKNIEPFEFNSPTEEDTLLKEPIFVGDGQTSPKNEDKNEDITENIRFSEPEDNDLLTQQEDGDRGIFDPGEKMYQMKQSNIGEGNLKQRFPDNTIFDVRNSPDEISRSNIVEEVSEPEELHDEHGEVETAIDPDRTINEIYPTNLLSESNKESEPETFTDKTVEHHLSMRVQPHDIAEENLQQSNPDVDVLNDRPIDSLSKDDQVIPTDVLDEKNRQAEPEIFTDKTVEHRPPMRLQPTDIAEENLQQSNPDVDVFTDKSIDPPAKDDQFIPVDILDQNIRQAEPEIFTDKTVEHQLPMRFQPSDIAEENFQQTNPDFDIPNDKIIPDPASKGDETVPAEILGENNRQSELEIFTDKTIDNDLLKSHQIFNPEENLRETNTKQGTVVEGDSHDVHQPHNDKGTHLNNEQPEVRTHHQLNHKHLGNKHKEDPYYSDYNKLGEPEPEDLGKDLHTIEESPSPLLQKDEQIFTDKKNFNKVDTSSRDRPETKIHKLIKNILEKKRKDSPYELTKNRGITDGIPPNDIQKSMNKETNPNVLNDNILQKPEIDNRLGSKVPSELEENRSESPDDLRTETKEENLPNTEVVPDINSIQKLPHNIGLKKFNTNKDRLNQYPPNFQSTAETGKEILEEPADEQKENQPEEEHSWNQDHKLKEETAGIQTRIADEDLEPSEGDHDQDIKDLENVLGQVKDETENLQETIDNKERDTDTKNNNAETDRKHTEDGTISEILPTGETGEHFPSIDISPEKVIDEIREIPLELLQKAEKTFENIESEDSLKTKVNNGSDILGSQPLENSLEMYQPPYSRPDRYQHKARLPVNGDNLLGQPLKTDPPINNKPTNSLGMLAPTTNEIDINNPQEMYFIGNGIKLPLHMVKKNDGALHLAVDLDKLCSCKNISCHKNESAIADAVGAILEKEAELKELVSDRQEENFGDMPLGMAAANFNKAKLENKITSDSVELQHENPDISKRSPLITADKNEHFVPKLPEFMEKLADNTPKLIQQTSNYLKDFVTQGIKSGISNMENINPLATSQEIIKQFVNSVTRSNSTKDETSKTEVTQKITTDETPSLGTRFRNLFSRPDTTLSTISIDSNSNTEAPSLKYRLKNLFDRYNTNKKNDNMISPIIVKIDDNNNLSNSPTVTTTDNRGNEKYDELSSIKKLYKFKEPEEQVQKEAATMDKSAGSYNKINEEVLKKEAKALLKATENAVEKEESGLMNNFVTWIKRVISDKKD